MTGAATYLGYELTYDLDVSGGSAAGTLSFEAESAPIHRFAESDRDPNAQYRELRLEDGSLLKFRVVGTAVTPHIVAPGIAHIESVVRIRGRIEPPA